MVIQQKPVFAVLLHFIYRIQQKPFAASHLYGNAGTSPAMKNKNTYNEGKCGNK